MAAQDVEVFIAGSAVWNTPVKLSESEIRTAYDASLMTRLTFADGSVHYLKLHMIGIEGTMTFTEGTGKWEGASGTAQLLCYGLFDDPDQEVPPVEPAKYYAVFEGPAKIDAPNLTS